MKRSPRQVLIVEDHPDVRAGYRELFGLHPDIEVCGAFATAEEALDRLTELKPDLVLSDVSLPGMDGLEMAARIGQREEGVPVIVVSGHPPQRYGETAQQAGVERFLSKGEPPRRLIETILEVLDRPPAAGPDAAGGRAEAAANVLGAARNSPPGTA